MEHTSIDISLSRAIWVRAWNPAIPSEGLIDNLIDVPVFSSRSEIRLSQNPSSMNLGTTVWDASIVMAKFLEKVLSL